MCERDISSAPKWSTSRTSVRSSRRRCYLRDARAGLRVQVLHRLRTGQMYRSNFEALGFHRLASLSTINFPSRMAPTAGICSVAAVKCNRSPRATPPARDRALGLASSRSDLGSRPGRSD